MANLNGSRDGSAPVLSGGVVNGPNRPSEFGDLGLPDDARPCPPDGGDPFKPFSTKEANYLDDVRAWPRVEPAIDFTATSVLALAQADRLIMRRCPRSSAVGWFRGSLRGHPTR